MCYLQMFFPLLLALLACASQANQANSASKSVLRVHPSSHSLGTPAPKLAPPSQGSGFQSVCPMLTSSQSQGSGSSSRQVLRSASLDCSSLSSQVYVQRQQRRPRGQEGGSLSAAYSEAGAFLGAAGIRPSSHPRLPVSTSNLPSLPSINIPATRPLNSPGASPPSGEGLYSISSPLQPATHSQPLHFSKRVYVLLTLGYSNSGMLVVLLLLCTSLLWPAAASLPYMCVVTYGLACWSQGLNPWASPRAVRMLQLFNAFHILLLYGMQIPCLFQASRQTFADEVAATVGLYRLLSSTPLYDLVPQVINLACLHVLYAALGAYHALLLVPEVKVLRSKAMKRGGALQLAQSRSEPFIDDMQAFHNSCDMHSRCTCR